MAKRLCVKPLRLTVDLLTHGRVIFPAGTFWLKGDTYEMDWQDGEALGKEVLDEHFIVVEE